MGERADRRRRAFDHPELGGFGHGFCAPGWGFVDALMGVGFRDAIPYRGLVLVGILVCDALGWVGCVCAGMRVIAGIRVTLARFTRCPCAGRHLLFFAAAKKSRQKKAAHTASA